jgi:hypothetical protein
MKLIDEAIDLLGDASEPLAKAFFKAQVIAHKLQDKEFAQWVRNEIQGYDNKEAVPDYRVSNVVPYGNLENMARRYSEFKLSSVGMPDAMRERHLVARFDQSIAVIEEFERNGEKLVINLDHRLSPYLMAGIDDSYAITNAWGKLPAGCFTQILNEARSRLLDLLLNLADLVPTTENEQDPKHLSKIEGLNDMFKGAVFGHGANINFAIGEHNQASQTTNSVVVNDIDSLVRELTKNKVSQSDILGLKDAIAGDADLGVDASQGFGEKVRTWLGAMIAKAGTPAWEIPVQVGAGLLTNALSTYYGVS